MDFSVKTMVVGPVGTNCYILKDNNSSEGMIIDPGDNTEGILAYIKENDIDVKLIALTHGHFDHIGAVEELRQSLAVPVAVHEADADMITDGRKNLSAFMGAIVETEPADIILRDGDCISFGKCSLRVISTPGHTRGSVCYEIEGELFTGDTLFDAGWGRTDLPGGSDEMMMNSLNRLIPLARTMPIHAGH